MTGVAFQGEDGAFSQEAIFQTFGPDIGTLACRTFDEVFGAVKAGHVEYGMIPIEHSTAGALNQSYDLLLIYHLPIVREVVLKVRLALVAQPGVTLQEIRQVYSHPAALAQCERYIADHGWEPIVAYDTAGAAKEVATKRDRTAAAIASETAARIYRMSLLEQDVQDLSTHYTRFLLIARQEAPRSDNCMTSLVFATQHVPGALNACLGELASRRINLTKIESRPDRRDPWHYVFYVDVLGHKDDLVLHDALAALAERTLFLDILGSYPAAQAI